MAIQALYSAASGLKALSTKIDVTANNLANVSSTGFKASRAEFGDLFASTQRGVSRTGQAEGSRHLLKGVALGSRLAGVMHHDDGDAVLAGERL